MSLLRELHRNAGGSHGVFSISISHGGHDEEDYIVTFEAVRRVMNER